MRDSAGLCCFSIFITPVCKVHFTSPKLSGYKSSDKGISQKKRCIGVGSYLGVGDYKHAKLLFRKRAS